MCLTLIDLDERTVEFFLGGEFVVRVRDIDNDVGWRLAVSCRHDIRAKTLRIVR